MRIQLTTPDGRHFEVDPEKIDILEEPVPGTMTKAVKAVISVSGRIQGVTETVAQIKAMEKAT
jgi:hypothetical protein